jgi:hypothetical protein
MSFTDSNAQFLYAINQGDPIKSSDLGASLSQHNNGNAGFNLNLVSATGGSSVNPFVATADTGNGTSTGGPGASPTTPAVTVTTGTSSGSGAAAQLPMVIQAHGIVMGLAFVIFFPLGALTIRVLTFTGSIWVHASAQIFAFLLAIAGMGMGIWQIANGAASYQDYHPIIGLVVVAALVFQPIGGLIHHTIWKKTHQPTLIAKGHVWAGRGLILLGVINGGFGLQLRAASDSLNGSKYMSAEIAYGVIAGVVLVLYVTVVVMAKRRRGNARTEQMRENKYGSGDATP